MTVGDLPSVIGDLDVSRETILRLHHFVGLCEKWTRTSNLIAPSTLADIWSRHILDSVQISIVQPAPLRWIDIGSGGGFPGLVTAILLAEKGAGWVHLIESNRKKAAFLRLAIVETGARASIHPVRIEAAQDLACDAISARAVADLSTLLSWSQFWFKGNFDMKAFFHKGRDYQHEIDNAVSRFEFDLVRHQSKVDPESVVLEISHLQEKQ